VQRLVVDGGLLSITTLQDRFFTVEDIVNKEGSAGHTVLGDVDAVMLHISSVIPHPSRAWMGAVVLFVGVLVQRRQVDWCISGTSTAYFRR